MGFCARELILCLLESGNEAISIDKFTFDVWPSFWPWLWPFWPRNELESSSCAHWNWETKPLNMISSILMFDLYLEPDPDLDLSDLPNCCRPPKMSKTNHNSLNVIIVLLSLYHYHYVIIIISLPLCHYHYFIIIMSLSLCHYHYVIIIMSLSICHCHYVIIIMSLSLCHYHYVITIMSLSLCHYQ